ncbi:serine/threonine protein kinase [[Bacillus] enclensis]|uniref:Serine/threonine protein kinase n=2 Tax=[Bacillus] enclensis TaxID=1402860 RepID=A0A1C4DT20_9BACI|nr:serine/threonine protein kinase [[Bacillus] enclensis]
MGTSPPDPLGGVVMLDVKTDRRFKVIEPVNKGWSSDKKYYVETVTGERLLLRTADRPQYEMKKSEFEAMKQLAEMGISMSNPLEFGLCDEGDSVYTLFSWCDGEDAAEVLPKLTDTEQYELGLKSGRYLRQIHSIPAPADEESWEMKFNRKVDSKIKQYNECAIKIDGGDQIIAYIEANRHLLVGRPQSFHHGDYHVGNMVISEEKELSIIDFNRHDFGDPWEEFNRIVWSASASPHFATGQLNGYFGGRPPEEFFKLMTFYISSNMLSSISWAIVFGEKEVEVMKEQANEVMEWFDGMNNPVPTWYLEDFYVQYINQIPYKLKSPFDFSFIKQYGEVFKVYDDQDSGNISFGVKNGDDRYLIKFAGAPTARYQGKPEDAIAELKAAVHVYEDLAHPYLVRLIRSEEAGGGFAAIFEWTDGECMGRMYPLSREKFMRMPDKTRLGVFSDIIDFHIHVIKKGYVAIDFYDGSILFDFKKEKTFICDIDLYTKCPYMNEMGRMWGSSRFMSPEEFELGAKIDEITNVYLMGATAFALFGGETDRSHDKWRLSGELYNTAAKAVSDDRTSRHQTLAQFKEEWVRGTGKLTQ